MFGEHFFSDFNGYGFQEVMENQLLSFNREFSKGSTREKVHRQQDYDQLLKNLPGLSTIKASGSISTTQTRPGSIHHSEHLGRDWIASPRHTGENYCARVGRSVRQYSDEEGELEWREAMVKEVLQPGIEFKGAPYGIERLFETDGQDRSQLDKPDYAWKKWKKFDWPTEVFFQEIPERADNRWLTIRPGVKIRPGKDAQNLGFDMGCLNLRRRPVGIVLG
ncbi:uncharacterized protein Z519_02784 [Cladophialophora bantiana CBS 173.52]|uniref:Uncharacterized protein n=1 Tax=Cladophialophora bantiana (strain ATCC 10958 / CBS 173.52 / CDC B-1940 / NIH 8579) TaxID=1442370 RepID=A0A0D2GGA5_CLAB1|nr:uncharacterized protein Z519_02784 [Cladophialophora bantiana CBS 173.52]KIW97392.1 hypothetical protein Z519_02784 [Cladophialophora bantiana CBS 173.52]